MTLMLSGTHFAKSNRHARPRMPQLWGVFLLCVMALLTGCATGPNANPRDPLEPLNREVFKFNDVVDKAVLKPVATVYRDVTPVPVRKGVANFFDNGSSGMQEAQRSGKLLKTIAQRLKAFF